MPPLDWGMIILGCIGGVLPDVVRIIQYQRKTNFKRFPEELKKGGFYISLMLQILLGGFTAWFTGVTLAQGAILTGFSAPELITRLAADQKPAVLGSRVIDDQGRFHIRRWWAV